MRELTIVGASEHNLRDVDLTLQHGQWIAVTGPSGSGKTSLVFDTIVAESQRRYLGSLSARARHYLGKLGRADVRDVDGLPVAIAIGQHSAVGHARSTVGTVSGLSDLLRLLFARVAVDPLGEALARSHFSFNHPLGACPDCQGLGLTDRVDPELLLADPAKSIRDGALVPTLKNGYTVYSQVTLEVMDQICGAHGFSVHTPWKDLSDAQRDVVLYGTKALEVPFGKHSIESRMRWKGITARPRQQGYYRGLVPVIEETLARSRNPGVLRFVRSSACATCDGSRLSRPGRQAQIGTLTLPSLQAQAVDAVPALLDRLPDCAVTQTIVASLRPRVVRMQRLGLGHLSLDRGSTTLSGGEAQRIRLAAQLTADLTGMVIALDEPTLGLHPSGQAAMAEVIDALVQRGNTAVVVEHDPDMVRRADRVVSVGPGAGPQGGRIVDDEPTEAQRQADPLGGPPSSKAVTRPGGATITLRGATLHNLQSAELVVRAAALNVVVGPSGAGKSSLVFGTLLPALMNERGGVFSELLGATPGTVRALDARPMGKTSRSTPATFSGVFDLIRARFAATDAAKARGFAAGRFSYNNKDGRCPACEGLGVTRVGLHLLADARVQCSTCSGRRYEPTTLEVELAGHTIADVLAMSVAEAAGVFGDDAPIHALLTAMDDLGLGYLQLGQSSASLSRGEAQRVKLAALLGRPSADPTLLVLDEPDRGLHPSDIRRLVAAFDALVDAGHTVLAISHHRHLWAAADFITEVQGGISRPTSIAALPRLSERRPRRPPSTGSATLSLRGVSTNNLQGIDLELPHNAMTAVVGVSGSGKSSLAFDTIAAESWHRFAESLPFAVRRFVRQMPRPALEAASGLRPALAVRQGQARASRRSTVATQTELGPLLRLLWSRLGEHGGQRSGLSAEHFSPDRPLGACSACEGLGATSGCDPALLVTDPDRPLADGAMAGTRPGRFFTEPDGQYIATLQAALGDVDLSVPWRALSEAARRVALYGAGDRQLSVRWQFKRGKRQGEHRFEGTWDGLCALVEREAHRRAASKQAADWAAANADADCARCGGARLEPEVAAVTVGGLRLPDVMAMPMAKLGDALASISATEPADAAVLDALRPPLVQRVEELCDLGLGHLHLGRPSQTLSEGERQRARLASVLRSALTGLTIVVDEPGAGLHPREVERLVSRLLACCARGNTVVVVAHRPELIAGADHIVELGPGAGPDGGRIVAQGARDDVLGGDSATAAALRSPPARRVRTPPSLELEVRGARVHNLADIDVALPGSGFVAITGMSGSGKTSLAFDVLHASAVAGRPVGCAAIEGLTRFKDVRAASTSTAATTPLMAFKLMPALQRLFAPAAKTAGLPAKALSYASPAGRCETCKGTGKHAVALDVLADLVAPCPACQGRRYRPEVLAVRWQGRTVADVVQTSVAQARAWLPDGALRDAAHAMVGVGLGHLSFGRDRGSLSGGELQRLTVASCLVGASSPCLVVLDEPATGLHETDLQSLIDAFDALGQRGDLVVATEHRSSLVAAADWVVDLGPGGGPNGGRVVYAGPPRSDA